MPTCDAAVIGAGVFGSWIAYRLSQEGMSVVLADAYGPANSRASSGGESRIIRMGYGADEIYTRFAFRALTLWKEFFEKTGRPLFHKTGVLWIGAADHPRIHDSREVLRKLGVPFEELSASEIVRRYPQIRLEDGLCGVFEPESGALMARQAVRAVVDAARNAGVEYLEDAIGPVRGNGALASLRTVRGTDISAGTYVFACGAWLPKAFPNLLGARIFPTRQEAFFFGVPAASGRFRSPELPVWLDNADDSIPYGFPSIEHRGFKLAFDRHGPAFDPDTGERLVSAGAVAQARVYLAKRFPGLANAPLVESRVCQYENTSNGDFLVDRHPSFDNVWLVGGGSGHGFKHGPSIAEYVAGRIHGRGVEEERFLLRSKEEVQSRRVF